MTSNVKRAFALCLTAVFALNSAFSQEQTAEQQEAAAKMRLSADEAVELAVKNNLSLEIQRVETGVLKKTSDYSWNRLVPELTLSGGGRLANSNSTTKGDLQEGADKSTNSGLNITPYGQVQASFRIDFGLFEAMNTLKMNYEGGLITLEKARLEMERDVRKTYYNIMTLEEQVKQLHESLANAERQARSAETQYRAGRQPELTYLQARVSVQAMQPSIDEAENGLKLAKSNFALTLGLPLDTDFEFFLPVEAITRVPLDVKDLVKRAKENHPDILKLKQDVRALQSRIKATTTSSYAPILSLSWTGDISATNSNTTSGTNLRPDSTSVTDTFSRSGTFNIGLSWTPTNLLSFGTSARALQDMDDNLKVLSIGLAQAEQGAELDITNKVFSLEQIGESIEALRASAALAERSYTETLRAYNSGLQTLLQVQNAELQLRDARLNIYKQEGSYIQGLIDLEYAIGAKFGSLASEMRTASSPETSN
jgi:outer membrane protein TolC